MNNTNKRFLFAFILGVFIISLFSFVSAGAGDDLAKFASDAVDVVTKVASPVFGAILGAPDGEQSGYFLARILFLFILFGIFWASLKNVSLFSGNMWILVIVSGAVSILATRFLGSKEVLDAVLLPYSVIGVTLTCFIPIILFFIVLEKGFGGQEGYNRIIRITGWILFMVIFLFLWVVRYNEFSLGVPGNEELGITAVAGYTPTVMWIYFVSAILCLIFFLMDGTIQKWFAEIELQKLNSQMYKHGPKLALRKKRADLTNLYTGEQENYSGVYTNQKGHEGYKADMNRIKEIEASFEGK